MKTRLLFYLFLILAIRSYGQCTLNVTLSQSAPSICSGYDVTLTAAVSGGKAPFTYVWNTGETTPSINVNKAGTYTVTVSDKTPGCSPVKKSIAIAVSTTPNAPSAKGVVVCPNTSATLTATAPGGLYQWYDALKGGNFLGSGATYVTPPINSVTAFYVETTVGGCTSARTTVVVTLTAKPAATGVMICAGNVATLTASGGANYTWYDASVGGNLVGNGPDFTTPVLNTTTTYYVASTTNGCTSSRTAVTVTVTPKPPLPTAANTSVCSGSSANLHASAPSGIFNWYNTPAGGSPLISSPDYTTPPLVANTFYYVTTSINGCESARVKVLVTVNPLPSAPATQNYTTCYKSSAVLKAPGGAATYEWYDAQTGGNLLASGATFTTPVLTNSATYYLQADNGGCVSSRAAVNVTVTPQLPAPTAAGSIICAGSTATLTASSAGGGTFQWFAVANGGALLASGASFTTPVLNNTTTYYVQNTIAGCLSPRAAVTVTVNAAVPVPTANGVSICSGSSATLSATGSPGGYAWYDKANGGTLLATTQTFVTPALAASTSYYVESTTASCNSARVKVSVTVTVSPAAPTVNPVSVCPGTSATLKATGTAGTVTWYDAAAGGNLLFTGPTYKTPALNANTTYYAQATTGQCVSSRTAVTVTITTLFDPQFQYSSGSYCSFGPNEIPVINNPNGGVFSAAPAGLVFVSTTTGEINISASAPGTYTISFAGNGNCAGITTARLVIGSTANTTFAYNTPFCQFGPNPLPTFPAGAGGGKFTASPAGLVFVNTSTGEIDLTKSTPGPYVITNTIPAGGPCPASQSTFNITINPSAVVNAGPNQNVPAGSNVQLAGSIVGAVNTGTWSGGTGSFSNPSSLTAVYTPGPGETVAKLTLTSTDPPGPCVPASSSVTITFSPNPGAPTAQSINNCAGSTATLSATAPGGTYEWYDANVAGNLLSTGPNFTTPVLNANVTYYVQTTVNGITSARTPVSVTVNAVPAAPTAAPGQTCTGTGTTLTASGSAGSYQWYDAAVGGNLLSNTSTYTTPSLSAATSFYVQTTVNGCISPRTKVDVTVTPIPNVTSVSKGVICSGVSQNYTITADVAGTTFTWSRAAVAGISNPAVNNQASSSITESLINTSTVAVNVTYVITPLSGTCSGPPLNYVVTVYPTPVITSPVSAAICDVGTDNYVVTFNIPVTAFSWSRAAVPGITNAAVTGQTATTIKEVLFNSTNNPIDVTYAFNFKTATCDGTPTNLVITVYPQAMVTSASTGTACTGAPQSYVLTSNIPAATFNWSRAAVAGISNAAVANQVSSTITETLVNTTFGAIDVVYTITPIANGCSGTPYKYTVTVNPQLPVAVANSNSPVCLGSTVHLTTPPVTAATYLWTGPNGYTSQSQNPDITNATHQDEGIYTMVFTVKGCSSSPVQVVVTVDDPPLADAGPTQTVCIGTPVVSLNGSVTGGTSTGIWTTAGSGTFSKPDNLQANYTPSAADRAAGSVTLTLTSTSKDNCKISTSNMKIIFDPGPVLTGPKTGQACTGVPQNYVIQTNVPGATFNWSRAKVAGISNPAVVNQTSGTITETLVNTTNSPINVVYTITPTGNGCPGTPFTYTAIVSAPLPVAAASSNSPVCVGNTVTLGATSIVGATYAWTGPNGYTSQAQNPSITNVTHNDAGTYTMVFTLNGCSSAPLQTVVAINDEPIPDAGADQLVCIKDPTVLLSGIVTGGTSAGVWSTSGTGTFVPSNTTLQAQYMPSAADKSAGSVILTLTTTDKNCTISSDDMTLSFGPLPAVNAGPDQAVCSQETNIPLAGTVAIPGGGTWSTLGTGTFNAPGQLNATYTPGGADITNGSVLLVLKANTPGVCYIATDTMQIKFIPPPSVYAGGPRYILKGSTITLTPTVSDPNVHYLWSPNTDINNDTLKNPTITGDIDRTYTLTVTDERGCIAQDSVFIKVAPLIKINNTFTPNGDGINDTWEITGLIAYQDATVDIFDRYGQKVFHSLGYPKAWDGTSGGKAVPVGVYYYVINTHFNGQVLSGYVTVLR